MNTSLAEKLQVWGIDSDSIIYKDGSLGFCLEVKPLDATCWDENKLNDLHVQQCQFLNSIPSNTEIQFIRHITGGNESVITENEQLCEQSKSDLIQGLGQKRVDHLRRLDSHGLIPKYKLFLVVRKPLSKPLVQRTNLLAKSQEFPKITERTLEMEVKKLKRLQSDLISQLQGLGCAAAAMDSHSIIERLYVHWNPNRNLELGNYDPSDIRNSILFSDVAVGIDGFSIGPTHYKVISLKNLPGHTHAGLASVLQNLPFESELYLSIRVPDQNKEIESLQLQRRLTFSMVYGKQTGVSDLESEAKLQDLEGLIAQLISQGEKVFHFGLNVVLQSKDPDVLDEQVSQTLMTLRELSGAEGMQETLAAFEMFTDFSFPNGRARERLKRIKTSNLADLLPIYGPWTGHAEPKILLRSRSGTLVKFNPFSRELTNANQIISGGSGSGKSFLTNLLLIQMLKEDPSIFIVDIGGSYQKTCENLDGQYIPLGVDSGLSINPFDLNPGDEAPSSDKVKFLLALIESMTKEETESNLKKLERSEIEQAILTVYEATSKPKLSNLKNLLLKSQNPEVRRIGSILKTWCGDTPYGKFLDRDSTVDFHKSTVCFDLKGLEQYQDLQKACLLLISDLVIRKGQTDRSRMKFLVFDECWALLEGEGANFVGSIFRTCRKYFMSCIAISQNIDDFARSSVATAIMTNSSIKWILRQKGSDKNRLKEVLELNDTEISLISSLQQEKGIYSEAFLMCEDKKCLVAVESTPHEYWLATTDPRDLALLDRERQTLNPENQISLISHLAEEFPQGASS